MDIKLDENFGPSTQKLFLDAGHTCATVPDENLSGADDPEVLKAAVDEGRILVTMDHDFGNVLIYPPEKACGTVVINPPGRVSRTMLRRLIVSFLNVAADQDLHGKLWIVEPGRIRKHETSID
jgi:predicted nuclease of predicted toxin-antitoxin system